MGVNTGSVAAIIFILVKIIIGLNNKSLLPIRNKDRQSKIKKVSPQMATPFQSDLARKIAVTCSDARHENANDYPWNL